MQADLSNEADYNLQRRHPERTEIYAGYARRSEALRQARPWQALRYAPEERCTIDFFPAPDARGAPLLVFIHGGFWRGGDKRMFSFIAEHFLAAGISTALLGYTLAPAVTVAQISAQIRAAVACLTRLQPELGFDIGRVTLSGHSAGAHLAAMTSSCAEVSRPAWRVLAVSGVYDLRPVLATSLRAEIGLTQADAEAQSLPGARQLLARDYLVAVGGAETPAFISQSEDFHRALTAAGRPAALFIDPGRTHFDIFESLSQPGQALHDRAIALIQAP